MDEDDDDGDDCHRGGRRLGQVLAAHGFQDGVLAVRSDSLAPPPTCGGTYGAQGLGDVVRS